MLHLLVLERLAASPLGRSSHCFDVHPALGRHGRDLLPISYPNDGIGNNPQKNYSDGWQYKGKDLERVSAILRFFAVVRLTANCSVSNKEIMVAFEKKNTCLLCQQDASRQVLSDEVRATSPLLSSGEFCCRVLPKR